MSSEQWVASVFATAWMVCGWFLAIAGYPPVYVVAAFVISNVWLAALLVRR